MIRNFFVGMATVMVILILSGATVYGLSIGTSLLIHWVRNDDPKFELSVMVFTIPWIGAAGGVIYAVVRDRLK